MGLPPADPGPATAVLVIAGHPGACLPGEGVIFWIRTRSCGRTARGLRNGSSVTDRAQPLTYCVAWIVSNWTGVHFVPGPRFALLMTQLRARETILRLTDAGKSGIGSRDVGMRRSPGGVRAQHGAARAVKTAVTPAGSPAPCVMSEAGAHLIIVVGQLCEKRAP